MSESLFKVKCVNNNGYSESLTKQNLYDVVDEDETEYKVKDNKGWFWYSKGRFEGQWYIQEESEGEE